MDEHHTKGIQFVRRLLANTALTPLPLLQKEIQTIDFLKLNLHGLYPTLSSPDFFPGMSEKEIMEILSTALTGEIDKALLPFLDELLARRIDFSFISHFGRATAATTAVRESVRSFLGKTFRKPEIRRAAAGPLAALEFDLIDRYIDHSLARREYVCMELLKVQRLKMEPPEIKQFLKVTLLFKPAYALLLTAGEAAASDGATTAIPAPFIERSIAVVREQLQLLPEEVIKSALAANISALEKQDLDATSRIAAVFSARALSLRRDLKVDRGADTPDKSWFSIARRNYRFYGFDVKILDEFYKIAAETGY